MGAALLTALAGLGTSHDAFRARMELALAYLQRTSLADLLDCEHDGIGTRRLLERYTAQVEHVGMMAPHGLTLEAVAELATAAGFDLRHLSFPSMLVARELGSLQQRDTVPTTIFRASAEGAQSRRVGIEIFIPVADAATIETWIHEGVVSHIAIELQRPHDDVFAETAGRMEAAGFTVPTFLSPRPFFIPNPSSDLRTLYFDRRVGGDRSRIEVFALGDLAPRPVGRRRTDTKSDA